MNIFGWWITAAVVGQLWLGPIVDGERFLSAAEAGKVCFPAATDFVASEVRLRREQKQAIEKRCGSAVGKEEVRFWEARDPQALLGVFVVDHVLGKHDLIEYGVAISPAGKVLRVEILEYREKYGSEIRSPKWRAQFAGKSADSPLRLNEDISNISGATISCRHVTEGVKRVLATYQVALAPLLGSASGLPDSRPK